MEFIGVDDVGREGMDTFFSKIVGTFLRDFDEVFYVISSQFFELKFANGIFIIHTF